MTLRAPIPVLRSNDADLLRRFYVDWLGFRVDWEHRFRTGMPLYVQVSRGAAVLHLSEHLGDAPPGGKVLIPVDDVEAYHSELRSRPHPGADLDVEDQPWGRELTVTDPCGNRLVFLQPAQAI